MADCGFIGIWGPNRYAGPPGALSRDANGLGAAPGPVEAPGVLAVSPAVEEPEEEVVEVPVVGAAGCGAQGLGSGELLGALDGGALLLLLALLLRSEEDEEEVEEDIRLEVPIMASIIGSWNSVYKRRSALNPPGIASKLPMARSVWRIISRIKAGLRAICRLWRNKSRSCRMCDSCGFLSMSALISGFDIIIC